MTRVTTLFGLLLASFPAGAADLTQIGEELREVQTSIASIRLEYVTKSPTLEVETVYIMSGPMMRVTQRAPEIGISSYAFDGEFGYQTLHDPSNVDQMRSLNKEEAVPISLLGHQSPLKWYGLPIGPIGKPLWELIEDAKIVGESEFNGWPVVEVDLGDLVDRAGGSMNVTCKLSKSHGFAPVVLSYFSRTENIALKEHVVESFREIYHPLLKRKVWFPERMTFGPKHTVELKSVTLNPHISKAEFIPQPDAGTQVWDKTARRGRQSYVHGGKDAHQQILEQAATTVPPLNSGVTAVPTRSGIPAWTWLVFGSIAVSAAGWLWLRQS